MITLKNKVYSSSLRQATHFNILHYYAGKRFHFSCLNIRLFPDLKFLTLLPTPDKCSIFLTWFTLLDVLDNFHPQAKTSEKGNFRHERRNQFKRFWGHVLNTIQSNLKFGKFLLQKQAKICMFFRTLTRNIDNCELAMKSRKKFQSQ